MNILFCYSNWMNPNRGGVQRVSDTLAKYFVSQGHVLYYLTLQFDCSDTYNFPAKTYILPNAEFFSNENIEYYHKLLIELSIDIIINHDAANDHCRLFLNTGNTKPTKISLYHTNPLYGINNSIRSSGKLVKLISNNFSGVVRLLKALRKRREIEYLVRNSDRLVVLSDEYIKQIKKELFLSSSKIQAINNPCATYSDLVPVKKKKQILFVARIELPVKRPDLMIEIWSQLQNKYPDWELLFLGDGPDRLKVEEIAREGKVKNVIFKGFVDPVSFYQEASILCMTSEYEGFPSVLLEAMQFGVTPITFNNWPSLKDVIEDKETGILVQTGNVLEYVIKLDQLLSGDQVRKRISTNAQQFVKKFQIENIGPKWDKLFEDIQKEKK